MHVCYYIYININIMDRGAVLKVKSTYTSFVKENSSGDIFSAVVIAIQAIVATTIIIIHLIA